MIRHVTGDLFQSDEIDVIAHQVNCRGVMGSGVARQVRQLFPLAFTLYKEQCDYHNQFGPNLLGRNQYVNAELRGRKIIVANMFAQLDYGYDGKQYTSYDALRSCLRSLGAYARKRAAKIGLPYRIACDRGGADWDIVYGMICEELHDCEVTLFELSAKEGGLT